MLTKKQHPRACEAVVFSPSTPFSLLTPHFYAFSAENVDVQNLKDADRVDNEHRDKPPFCARSRRSPKRETLPDKRPNQNNRQKNAHARTKLTDAECIAPHAG
jgi:hypothetical protein